MFGGLWNREHWRSLQLPDDETQTIALEFPGRDSCQGREGIKHNKLEAVSLHFKLALFYTAILNLCDDDCHFIPLL